MRRFFYTALMLVFVACTKTETTQVTHTESAPAATETTSSAVVSETTSTQVTATTSTTATSGAVTSTTVTTATTATTSTAASAAKPKSSGTQEQVADIKTTAGDITIRFFPDVAPNHVKNFIDLARSGFYDGTKFHRVIPGFMIQGGDPNTKTNDTSMWGMGGSGKNVNAEFSTVHHSRGIVSMARSPDPNSASSQFFIVVADASNLDGQYSAFGLVTKGMDIADKIVNAPRGANDRPDNPTMIKSITIRPAKDSEKGPTPR